MTSNNPFLTVIILAAGKGTRMKSRRSKLLHEVASRPLIAWVLEVAESLDPAQIITVIGPDMPDLEQAVARHTVAIQPAQKGTADAVKAALPLVEADSGRVLILLGDEPFIPVEVLQEMVALAAPSVMAVDLEDATGLGRMICTPDGRLEKIVEEKDASAAQRAMTLGNAGNFCLDYTDLTAWLAQITPHNAQGEYYLTDLVEIARAAGREFQVVEAEVDHGWGINDRIQLAEHERYIQDGLRFAAMREGVTMTDPMTVYLSADTQLGRDVTIEPQVVIGAGVRIGEGCRIKAGCRLEHVTIGRHCEIGPFAHLKGHAQIGDHAIIGNFVEVQRSVIGDGVKAKHLAYISDADIGKNSNIGCGAITVNYDGFQKHRTKIGDNVMVGSNVNLIAPIDIGDDAFIAAGSTISENIPKMALGVERSKTEIKEGWVTKYRQKKGRK